MKKSELAIILLPVGELYDKKISESLLGIYYEIFKNYSIADFKNAIERLMKSYKFNSIPKPADILEYLEGSVDDKARKAWILAQKGVEDIGHIGSVKFNDPIISNVIVALGGWQNFCLTLTEDLPFLEKRFIDYYKMFEKRGDCEPLELIGFLDSSNRLKGYFERIKPAFLIEEIGKEKKLLTGDQGKNH